jgi:signal transduction histidine kinase
MSEGTRQRAFEPFFTTKQGGTGLGLAIVYRTAEVHRGSVRADAREGAGSTFTLHFPRLVNEAAA